MRREGLLHGECLIGGFLVGGRIEGMLCAFFFGREVSGEENHLYRGFSGGM